MSHAQEMRRYHERHEADYDNRRNAVLSIRQNALEAVAELEEAHRRLAARMRERMSELDAHRARLASELDRKLHDLGASREQMGRDQDAGRKEEHARLEATVNQMREHLHADLEEGQHVWHEHARQMQDRVSAAGKQHAPTHRKAGGGSMGGDLTTISGIGAGRQQRLNEVGIHTFADLAGANPSALRDALGASGRLVNVEEWIQEAKSWT